MAEENDSGFLYGFENKPLRKGPVEMSHLCGHMHMGWELSDLVHRALAMSVWSVPNCACAFIPL